MTIPDSVTPEQRARNLRGLRRFGVGCSAIGGLLLVAAAVVVYGVVLFVGDDGGAAFGLVTLAAVLCFFAMVLLVTGEQLRRGKVGRNPSPPNTLLPSASWTSRFGLISPRWQLLWIVLALVVAVSLVVPVVVGFATGGWPHSLAVHEGVETMWATFGAVASGVAAGLVNSLSKKQATAAHTDVAVPERGRKAWRFWLYRWRVDVWLAGAGGFAVALFAVLAASDAANDDGALGLLVAIAVAGAVVAVVGIVLGRRFWRTGEQLGSAESYA